MGSTSDWTTMKHAADLLEQFGVHTLTRVVSAHRTPQRLYEFAASAEAQGLKAIIAGAGGAAIAVWGRTAATGRDEAAADRSAKPADSMPSTGDCPVRGGSSNTVYSRTRRPEAQVACRIRSTKSAPSFKI